MQNRREAEPFPRQPLHGGPKVRRGYSLGIRTALLCIAPTGIMTNTRLLSQMCP